MSLTLTEALAFSTRTAEEIAVLAVQVARSFIATHGGSRTLQKSMRPETTGPGMARVLVPHYWALYVHDGRGPIEMPPGKFMVFFPDRKDDPRTDFGTNYPVRLSDVQHLDRGQFLAGLEENRERFERGASPFMVVTKFAGPVPALPFFTEGLKTLSDLAGPVVQRDFRDFMARQLKGLSFKGKASASIG